MITPSRVAAFLAGLAGLLGAIAVPLANLETHDVSAVIAGVAAISLAALKWLDGRSKWEVANAHAEPDDDDLPADPLAPQLTDEPVGPTPLRDEGDGDVEVPR